MQQASRRAILSTAERIVQIITTELIPNEPQQPVDIGTYRAGWRADPTENGAFIVNTAPHAPHIEYGVKNVRPGASMLLALEEWVVRKRIGNAEEAKQFASAIMWSLKKTGIFNQGKGLHLLDRALERLPAIWSEELSREVWRIAR